MRTGILIKVGLIGAAVATSFYGYAKSVDSSDFFSLKAEELNAGTKSSVVANVSVSNTTSLDTDVNAPAYIIGEDHVGGTWKDVTAPYNCQDWTPHTNTVNFGVIFKQEQECDVTRERVIKVYDIWSDGKRTLKYEYKDEQSDGVISERQATGTKPYITGQYTTYTSWSNSGAPYSCGSWSPHENTVEKGKKFTQTSSCKQKQTKLKKTFNEWTDGRTDLVKTETLENVINTSKSRSATGTKSVGLIWKRGNVLGPSSSGQCEYDRNVGAGMKCPSLGAHTIVQSGSMCVSYDCVRG